MRRLCLFLEQGSWYLYIYKVPLVICPIASSPYDLQVSLVRACSAWQENLANRQPFFSFDDCCWESLAFHQGQVSWTAFQRIHFKQSLFVSGRSMECHLKDLQQLGSWPFSELQAAGWLAQSACLASIAFCSCDFSLDHRISQRSFVEYLQLTPLTPEHRALKNSRLPSLVFTLMKKIDK